MTKYARALAALLMCLAAIAPALAAVEYVYDENGRLVGVYAPNGDSAQYVYDGAGNITQINRITAGSLAIIEFQPRSGPVGSQVTIWGSGFSATPGLNTVTINGVAASVVSAATNKLVVTVPSATTGPIAVSVGGGSTTTTQSFVVTASINCASMFIGFSPAIGVAGASVAISGSNLDVAPASPIFNGAALATVQSATSSTLNITVPSAATSGRLSVSMPPKCGSSSLGDFFVPPSPFVATDIGATGRLTINGASAGVTLAAGKKALYVFDGAPQVGTALYLAGSTLGTVTADIRSASGAILATKTFGTATATVGPVYLPANGGFSIFINPSAAGSVTIQMGAPDLALTSPSVGTITANQSGTFNMPVSFTVTNLGPISAPPTWIDYGYLTTGLTLDTASKAIGSMQRNSALATNASYTVNQTYVISGVGPGTYNLFLRTDSTGAGALDPVGSIAESNENNNTSAAISVVLPTYPDLALGNASVGTITENQNGSFNVPVTFTVTNAGTNPALPTWADRTYLATNGVLDASSTNIGTTFRTTALAGGANYTVTQTYTTSGITPGNYTLFLKADGLTGSFAAGSGSVAESNETNNVASFNVVMPTYPDLAISNPSIGTITENQNGTFSVPVTFTVTNLGTTPAQPTWADRTYLSNDSVLDSSDTTLGTSFRITALAGSASYNVSQTYTTSGVGPGNYTVFLKTDGGALPMGSGSVVESDDTNNTTVGLPISLPTYPDLEISNPSVGTIIKNVNGTYNVPVTFTVTNVGTTQAKSTWADHGYISTTGTLTSSSTSIGQTFRTTALAGAASYNVSQTYVVSGFSAGNYTLFLKADGQGSPYATSNGVVVESSESNNVTTGISITLPQ
jgi:YD repeat-containing protein